MLVVRMVFSALILVGLGPGLARAAPHELAPAEGDSPPPAKADNAKGSHFLVEGNAGFGVAGASGVTLGALFGAGGRVPSTPLRLYLVGELARSTSERPAESEARSELVQDEITDAGLGLRGYVPVYGRLRFFGDASLGRSLRTSSEDASLGRVREWTSLFALAAGLQLRVIDELSCGARGRVAFAEDGLVGSSTHQRWSMSATLTAHF
jgi:hypothetical protein